MPRRAAQGPHSGGLRRGTGGGAAPGREGRAADANPARFGGDKDRAKFAKELAQCRAARIVNDEIDKRYRADVATAKKTAAAEAKTGSDGW